MHGSLSETCRHDHDIAVFCDAALFCLFHGCLGRHDSCGVRAPGEWLALRGYSADAFAVSFQVEWEGKDESFDDAVVGVLRQNDITVCSFRRWSLVPARVCLAGVESPSGQGCQLRKPRCHCADSRSTGFSPMRLLYLCRAVCYGARVRSSDGRAGSGK